MRIRGPVGGARVWYSARGWYTGQGAAVLTVPAVQSTAGSVAQSVHQASLPFVVNEA